MNKMLKNVQGRISLCAGKLDLIHLPLSKSEVIKSLKGKVSHSSKPGFAPALNSSSGQTSSVTSGK